MRGRHGERERRKGPQEAAAPIGRRRQDERRAQDDPVQPGSHQRVLGRQFGRLERALALLHADSRDLHQAAHTRRMTGLGQSGGRLQVDRRQIITRTVLQGAGAVHHRLHTLEDRRPPRHVQPPQVGGDPADLREPMSRAGNLAAQARHLMSGGKQARGDVASDQAVGADHQDAHSAFPPAAQPSRADRRRLTSVEPFH